MELNLQRQAITINEVVYDGYVEQPIECDALLPDYCPDIVGILKCAVTTHIGSTSINGDRLTVEGIAVAHVYYTTESNSIRHAEYKIPFGKTVDLRTPAHSPVIAVTPSVDYVNCRAVNQRRIDLRGALSLNVKVTNTREQEVICDASGGGLQLRRDMVRTTQVMNQTRFPFTVTEDLELGLGKGQIGNIVRSDCRANMQDYKIISGKVVIKGDLVLHILYQSLENEGNLEMMEYSLPISQIVDSEGTDEECVCDVQLMLASCDIQPKSGEDGTYHTFALDAHLVAHITAHRNTEIPVASDCYSITHECSCKRAPVSFIRLMTIVRESIMHKATLDLPENVESVMDAWCEVENMSWRQEDDAIGLALRLTVSMFAKMTDGQCLYFEQASDIEQSVALEADSGDIAFEPSADVFSSTYSLVGKEKIDIRCEVMVRGCVYCTIKHNAIGEITVDDSKVKRKETNKLYIYYADKGESIWDIAKHYNTSANAIWEENSGTQDLLPQKQMLLIPIV